jgi:hypothetical protein
VATNPCDVLGEQGVTELEQAWAEEQSVARAVLHAGLDAQDLRAPVVFWRQRLLHDAPTSFL